MKRMNTIVAALATVAMALPLAFGAAEAAKMKSANYQDGDCKQGYEMALGQDPNIAQALWTQSVSTKFGNKWAHWVGAKNKSIVAVPAAGGGVQFRALAQPCFYNPVQ
jgi:hypothetical protein